MPKKLASIIITNYNYGRFLSEAIESALNQTYQPTEVIVVDDGSTDDSQQIICSYGQKIIPLLKENGGQGSAFNAGFAVSRGELICFLDSDDVLLPTAIEQAVQLMYAPHAIQVHWPLSVIDVSGRPLGKMKPAKPLPEGNLYDAWLSGDLEAFGVSPTSGNAWSRDYLAKILPMPEPDYRLNADSYLTLLVPFFGEVKRIDEYQTLYRIHGRNGTSKRTYKWRLSHYQYEIAFIRNFLHEQGIKTDARFESKYEQDPYYKSLQRMVELGQELELFISPGPTYILVDMDDFGPHQLLENSQSIPFLEKENMYWGPPVDDATAIQEFDRLHREGASFIVFGWSAFWWLDYYVEFTNYIRNRFPLVTENERFVIFDLRRKD
jgi:glycosyltransferase involved in cell wall biosynthesis